MPFTPIDSTVGGLLIGMSVAGMQIFHGRVSGMSGQLTNFFEQVGFPLFSRPERRQPRFMYYIGGLVLAGLLLKLILSPYEAFNAFNLIGSTLNLIWKPNMSSIFNQPLLLFGLSGFLVGLGTALSNGCTSGHMLCGVARGSKRSIVATAVFCTVAFLTVQLLNRHVMLIEYYNTDMPPSYFAYRFWVFPSLARFLGMVIVLLLVTAGYVVFYFLGKGEMSAYNSDDDRWVLFMYLYNAVVFGLGLGYSGMTLPQKVLGFFAIGRAHWDPSLICVALFAIVPNFILYQFYIRHQVAQNKRPIYAKRYELPTGGIVDLKLIGGAALFGLGWGLSGICPGPAIVSVLFRGELTLYIAGFLVGVKVKRVWLDKERIAPPTEHIIRTHSVTGGPARSFSHMMNSGTNLTYRRP